MTGLGVLLPLVSPLLPEPGSSGPGQAATVPRGRGWAGLGCAGLGCVGVGVGCAHAGVSARRAERRTLHTLVTPHTGPSGLPGLPSGRRLQNRGTRLPRACLGVPTPRGTRSSPCSLGTAVRHAERGGRRGPRRAGAAGGDLLHQSLQVQAERGSLPSSAGGCARCNCGTSPRSSHAQGRIRP